MKIKKNKKALNLSKRKFNIFILKKKIHLSSGIFLINKKYKKREFYHYIKEPDNVMTIPKLKNKKFILVCQKREPINKRNYEFPSGWVNKEKSQLKALLENYLRKQGTNH